MSEKLTHQDQLVDYNQRICNKILSSQEVMALIANDPDLDLDSPEAAQWEDHIIDHAWVDATNIRTVTTANKFSGKLITYMVSDFARNRSLLP